MKNTKTIAPIVDIMTSTIYVTKSYYKAACTYGTKEYKDFREMLKDNEGFKIEFSGSDKKTYSKLTFEAMRAYALSKLFTRFLNSASLMYSRACRS